LGKSVFYHAAALEPFARPARAFMIAPNLVELALPEQRLIPLAQF